MRRNNFTISVPHLRDLASAPSIGDPFLDKTIVRGESTVDVVLLRPENFTIVREESVDFAIDFNIPLSYAFTGQCFFADIEQWKL